MFRGRSLAAVVVVSAAILGVGCRTGQTPEVRMLSEKEAADFWNRAESREPAGQSSVRKIESGTGTVVITTQAYTLRMPGGGGGGLVTVCGGGCQAGAGGPSGCQTSGCEPTGNSCTPLQCSGNCTLSHACKAEAWGFSSGGLFHALGVEEIETIAVSR